MADTTVTCTVSPCTVVLQIDVPLLNIDEAAGAQIAIAIVAVWTVGWSVRQLIRVLNSDGATSTKESET